MSVKAPTEAEAQRAVLEYLRLCGCLAIRCNSGAVVAHHNGKRRFFRMNDSPGMSDVVGVLPDGRFLAVEVKSATGRPTPEQASFLGAVNGRGGLGFVARSVEDVRAALKREGYEVP